jgi:hypothetical protein
LWILLGILKENRQWWQVEIREIDGTIFTGIKESGTDTTVIILRMS